MKFIFIFVALSWAQSHAQFFDNRQHSQIIRILNEVQFRSKVKKSEVATIANCNTIHGCLQDHFRKKFWLRNFIKQQIYKIQKQTRKSLLK